jgi:hypothetical protein
MRRSPELRQRQRQSNPASTAGLLYVPYFRFTLFPSRTAQHTLYLLPIVSKAVSSGPWPVRLFGLEAAAGRCRREGKYILTWSIKWRKGTREMIVVSGVDKYLLYQESCMQHAVQESAKHLAISSRLSCTTRGGHPIQ